MALALCLLAWVLWVLLRAVRQARVSDDPLDHLTQANAAVYREQWAELDRDRASGKISDAEWTLARSELELRLAQDVKDFG